MNKNYIDILNEELITAAGCTEPIALALAASKCREVLGDFPEKIKVLTSGNMIKNVKGVYIPNSGGLKGVRAAVVLGTLVNDSSKSLDILTNIDSELSKNVKKYVDNNLCTYEESENTAKLYIDVIMTKGNDTARVEVMHTHTNIVTVEKNGEKIIHNPCAENDFNSSLSDRKTLNVKDIFKFIKEADYKELKKAQEHQIEKNIAIANEGLTNTWGLCVGQEILQSDKSLKGKMIAHASAGSDARMGGSDLPVVINCGSGNQGMTIASPIYVYCNENNISEEQMYRALTLANLIPIHLKTNIGRLSAFCGAVTASCGVGSALTYLRGGDLKQVEGTIKNIFATLFGVVCDGAKGSCALKIASSLDNAWTSSNLALKNNIVEDNTGIIKPDIEETIIKMAKLTSEGMKSTDKMILNIMTEL